MKLTPEAAVAERRALIAALEATHGDVRAAAKRLGFSERTTWRRVKAYAINPHEYYLPQQNQS